MLTQVIETTLTEFKLPEILIRSGEYNRDIVFRFKDPRDRYISPEEFTAEFSMIKPDGNVIMISCETVQDGFAISTTEQMAAAAGTGFYAIRIMDNNTLVYSGQGPVLVDDHVISDETLESISEVHGLIFPADFLTKDTPVAIIDDDAIDTDTTWSSDKINSEIEDINVEVSKSLSGNPITFEDGADSPLVKCVAHFSAKQTGSGTPSPDNIRPIIGYSDITITVAGDDSSTPYTISLGSTRYGGELDVVRGVMRVTHGYADISAITWTNRYSGSVKQSKSANIPDYYIPLDTDLISDSYANCGGGNMSVHNEYSLTQPDGKESGIYTYFSNDQSSNMIQRNVLYWVGDIDDDVVGNICFKLATPTEIPLTPTQIRSLLGSNTITTDADSIDLEYITEDYEPIMEQIDELRELTVYRYDERIVGTWLDGRPIYEKSWHLENMAQPSDWYPFDNSISCDRIIDYEASYITPNNQRSTIGFQIAYNPPNARGYFCYYLDRTGAIYEAYVTIRYVK